MSHQVWHAFAVKHPNHSKSPSYSLFVYSIYLHQFQLERLMNNNTDLQIFRPWDCWRQVWPGWLNGMPPHLMGRNEGCGLRAVPPQTGTFSIGMHRVGPPLTGTKRVVLRLFRLFLHMMHINLGGFLVWERERERESTGLWWSGWSIIWQF